MNLSQEEADLFFRLMWELQFYVNRKLDIVPGVESAEAYKALDKDDKLKVRKVLYERMDLPEEFVSENPSHLSDEELQIVRSWQHRVAGEFFVLRHLKRYSIFISSGKRERVYGVLGLYDSLEDMMYGQPLPVWVEAVLLPFKGRTIYDGLLIYRNIIFGSGIRGNLNETYQAAKQADTIIESLEPGVEPERKPKRKKLVRDWSPVVDGILETTEQLKQAENVFQTRAFSVLKASARLAQAAAHDPDKLDEIARQVKGVQRALRQLETALSRAGWYDF